MPLEIPRIQSVLQELPEPTRQDLLHELSNSHFSGCLKHFSEAPEALAPQLIGLAKSFSLTPISGFHVGAVAIGTSGHLYLGANMEFVGVPLSASLHAEQSAVLNAWMHGEPAIETLIVSELPCGHCRQFLIELSNTAALTIIVGGKQYTLNELLPHSFGQTRQLGKGLLDSSPQNLVSIRPIDDDLAQRAVNSAQRSYTPYTGSHEGFVIECTDGKVYAGRAAECAAFNPSVLAVTSALNQRNLSCSRNFSITHCASAKLVTAISTQNGLADTLMRQITTAPIDHILMESA